MLPKIAFKYQTLLAQKAAILAEQKSTEQRGIFLLYFSLHCSQSYTKVYLELGSVRETVLHCRNIAYYVPFCI